ncbi:MAG: outer membrane lipoprotein chaperone LolA [Nitrospinales bacterium]
MQERLENYKTMNKLIIFVTLVSLTFFPQFSFADDKKEILNSVQKTYDLTKTFKANFVQISYLKIMDQTQTAKGEVFIKKPGKMKWDYKAPDPQILTSNDKGIWLYMPEEKQVTKMQMENIYSSNTPAMFLIGKGNLSESFAVDKVLNEKNLITLTLLPKDSEMNINRLLLFVNDKNYQITGSSVYDNLGNKTEIQFSSIQINQSISDNFFNFDVPEGVDIVDFSAKQ